jgi:HEAT repeat protein
MNDEFTDTIHELSSSDASVRANAVRNLRGDQALAQLAAVALVNITSDDDETVRETAVDVLENLGSPRTEDVGRLADLLDVKEGDVAYWAATLLGRCGEEAGSASESLNAALAHPESVVRQRAAWALGKIGSPATCALPSLVQAASSDDSRLAQLAQQAVAKIQS